MNELLPSSIFPLSVGRKWLYTVSTGLLFSREATVTVTDKRNSYYIVKIESGRFAVSAVVKSDVDMSIAAYSKEGSELFSDESYFEAIEKVELLKSPIISGEKWDTPIGRFNILSIDYNLKLDKKSFPNCVFVRLVDTSSALNDFFFRAGVGLVYGSLYIDGVGKVYIKLKKIG